MLLLTIIKKYCVCLNQTELKSKQMKKYLLINIDNHFLCNEHPT